MSTQQHLPDAEAAYDALLDQLKRAELRNFRLIGIHSGGVWLARRLARDLHYEEALGELDISFYRDDFDRIGLHAAHPTSLPFEVNDASILLIDDVLYTGRTIRGALNVLFDYGRPAQVRLAALIDRGRRELPIAVDYVGGRIDLDDAQTLVLKETSGHFSLMLEPRLDPTQR
jgi:pyrimidine operon attenuation protein / uracil phosphoribosyltransferase